MVDLCKKYCDILIIGVAEEIDISDFEDCLMDFMEFNFNVVLEDNSAKDVIFDTLYQYIDCISLNDS